MRSELSNLFEKCQQTELSRFLTALKVLLSKDLFDKIKYVVIQAGTSLQLTENTGVYDKNRMYDMIEIVKSYNKLSKEHNGDYQTTEQIKEKFENRLDAINIAPEFGKIETQCYLDNGISVDDFFFICLKSNKWVKWVPDDFDPYEHKKELILTCGHYVISYPEFQKIKPLCDTEIRDRIKNRLTSYRVYE